MRLFLYSCLCIYFILFIFILNVPVVLDLLTPTPRFDPNPTVLDNTTIYIKEYVTRILKWYTNNNNTELQLAWDKKKYQRPLIALPNTQVPKFRNTSKWNWEQELFLLCFGSLIHVKRYKFRTYLHNFPFLTPFRVH